MFDMAKLIDVFRSRLRPRVNGRIADIAREAGISREYLSMILNGRANPTLEVAESLAKATGCELSSLVAPENSESPA